jgi:hypothetical protein
MQQKLSGHSQTTGIGTKGVTTPALAPRARADTNAGLATVDDVCLATRHLRAWLRGRPDVAVSVGSQRPLGPRKQVRGSGGPSQDRETRKFREQVYTRPGAET